MASQAVISGAPDPVQASIAARGLFGEALNAISWACVTESGLKAAAGQKLNEGPPGESVRLETFE